MLQRCEDDCASEVEWFQSADIVTAGFPCQDISYAGEGAGLSGERSGLWWQVRRTLRMVRPRFALLENVAALLNRGMGTVLGSLAAIGYDAEWHCIPAGGIGAPHWRDRLWIIANPCGAGGERLVQGLDFGEAGSWRWRGEEDLRAVTDAPFEHSDRWPEPLVCRMDDGIPDRVERCHAAGNAVVPQIPELIGRAIKKAPSTNGAVK